MLKKIISLLAAAAILASLCAGVVFAADQRIVIGEGTGFIGDTVNIPVTVENNPGMWGMDLTVSYDITALKLKDVINGSVYADSELTKGNFESGSYKLSYESAELADTTKSGILATLVFEIKDTAEEKTYDIEASYKKGDIVNIDEKAVDFELVNGSVTVTEEPKKDITGAKLDSATYGYDGAVKSLIVKGTLPKGAEVTYENNSQSDAGVYDVTATIRAEGYNDKVLSAKLTINKKALTVTGLKAENKTYDGTADAVITGGTLTGAIKGDDVTAKMPEKGTFKSKDAAKGIAVSYGEIVLSGEKAKNYTVTQPALKADIAKASLTVKAEDEYIIKGQKPKLNYTVTEGTLFGDDKLTGALSTKADGTKTGEFAITQGTLKAPSNYTLKFVGGKVFVTDRTPQNITVAEIGEKTYGDGAFKIEVTKDAVSNLDAFTFESSNKDVAEVSADGTVTIKAAGEANITVKEAGNDTYAPFEKTVKLTVGKVQITVTAEANSKKVGAADPELRYSYTGKLIAPDTFTGALAREKGETVGKYDILIGTLAINSNYDITYNKAVFEIFDKTPQNITVAEIGEKTYGDGAFKIEVTKDAVSNLDAFTFESSNKDVAEVSADGTVTIKAAGEANITVKEAGNDEYAPFEKTVKLTVGKKAVTVTGINLDEKTAELQGLLEADTEVKLDFSKIAITLGDAVDETTSNAVVTGFALTGAKAENYIVTTESINATVKNENTVKITLSADKGTVTGAGTYLKGSEVTVTAAANSGYKFSGWYEGDKAVSADSEYTFTAEGDRELTAKFKKKSSGGGSSSSGSYKVSFETNGGSGVSGITVKKGQKIGDIEEPVKEGFVFGGWYSDKELTKPYDENAEVTASVTLYALWKVDPKRQIILTIDKTDAKVFGEKKSNDVAPIIKNERTMLPARFVAESLGAKVEWNEEAKTVTITKDKTVIVITIGSDKATVNGKEVALDSPAFIENNRTYTPIRFISENLGAEVEWDEETRKVTITK